MTDESAFPTANGQFFGMSLRDYFAGQEMIATSSRLYTGMSLMDIQTRADHCYRVAEAMLKARETGASHD